MFVRLSVLLGFVGGFFSARQGFSMGDLRDWSPEPNGAAAEERPSSSSPAPEDRGMAEVAAIGAEYWKRAEDATQGIIAQVQPTVVSEKRRRAVIDFVQRLIKGYLGCEVRN